MLVLLAGLDKVHEFQHCVFVCAPNRTFGEHAERHCPKLCCVCVCVCVCCVYMCVRVLFVISLCMFCVCAFVWCVRAAHTHIHKHKHTYVYTQTQRAIRNNIQTPHTHTQEQQHIHTDRDNPHNSTGHHPHINKHTHVGACSDVKNMTEVVSYTRYIHVAVQSMFSFNPTSELILKSGERLRFSYVTCKT